MQAESVLAEHRRLLDSLNHPQEVQHDLLTGILQQNVHTAFGREHGLAAVRTVDELRRAVPIRTHAELMPWIERTMDGEKNVLTADDPVVYFSSSGSTGREKHIPVTPTYMRRTFLPFYHAAFAPLLRTLPQALAVPNGVLNLWQDPTAPITRTRKGQPHIGASQVDYRKFGEDSAVGPGNDAAWSRIPDELAAAGPWDRAYYKLRLAAEQDIRLLIGINPAMVAALPYQLRELWPRLVEDIRAGTLDGLPHTTPNPERADEIERFAKTFGTVHPYHLWPRLTAIIVWNSALASLYLPRVRETYGPGVQLFSAPVASCEGPAAVPVDRHRGAPLYLPGCLYEFVPADGPVTADSQTLLATELEEHQDYHLVFSHVGGMYRCAVTDVVRVVGRAGRTPRIEYAGRDITRSAAGENLTEATAVRALHAACLDTGAEIRNATFHLAAEGHGKGGRYQVAVAFAGPAAPELATALDARLTEQCHGYRAGRQSGLIAPAEVITVHEDAFLREWERAVRAGQRPPRVKDRVFLPDENAWARITATRPEAAA
ncbi:GH3 family domain-containing protein [Streptomyces muensis]|uniref:GH3 auxin-responsive promoter family protein n=1 Tax=Streptomyces muensis TaxID=1077944 RepID=A0A9X1PYP5_STRM4|nr:GH3 auxin-responsive promoter family protein [Streptomyces muensis]MCF1594964.1 GH3 auxin-responsive promoter family protein [Streptomyces muensis]